MSLYTRVSLGRDPSGRPLVINTRTKAMLAAAERKAGGRFTLVQGSYRAGSGAAASAGTHDGGGVVDIRSWDLHERGLTVEGVVRALRQVGFAAWYRTARQGFAPHIHAVAIGDRQLAPAAARQVEAYRAGRNGLASNGPDDGPKVPFVTWEQTQRRPNVSLSAVRRAALGPRHSSAAPSTLRVQKALRARKLLGLYVPGVFGSASRRGYARWQRSLHYSGADANGIPGEQSLKALGRAAGFNVTP